MGNKRGRPGEAKTDLARHLHRNGLTYQAAVDKLGAAGVSVTLTWFGDIVRGKVRPSVDLARAIESAIGFPARKLLGV